MMPDQPTWNRATVVPPETGTHTSPKAAAAGYGYGPTSKVATTLFRVASIRLTVPSPWFGTKTLPSAAIAALPGPSPTFHTCNHAQRPRIEPHGEHVRSGRHPDRLVADRDRVGREEPDGHRPGLVGRGIDAKDACAAVVAHPDRARAVANLPRRPPDLDPGDDRVGGRVDPRHLPLNSLVAHTDPGPNSTSQRLGPTGIRSTTRSDRGSTRSTASVP
jgi:hypothetical protein